MSDDKPRMSREKAEHTWDDITATAKMWKADQEYKKANITGYRYQGQVWTPGELGDMLIGGGNLTEFGRTTFTDWRVSHGYVEDVLDFMAKEDGINRSDESSFSDQQFPKPIWRES